MFINQVQGTIAEKKNHYDFLISDSIPCDEKTLHTIPYTLFLTYSDFNKIPNKVWDLLHAFASNYDIQFFDDMDCISFLQTYFKPKIARRFRSLKCPAHKADLFRYCILYMYGGVYFDIKIKPDFPLIEIFDHNKRDVFYTVLSAGQPSIFQGVIATYPRNPIFIDLIQHILTTPNSLLEKDYSAFTKYFYKILTSVTKCELHAGEYYLNSDLGTVILFQELNKKVASDDRTDRREGYYNIFRNESDAFRIMKTRYNDFPW